MKRINRKLSNETKQKISDSMIGKRKSKKHRKAISRGMKAYWATIPNEENENKSINPLKNEEK